MGVGKVCIVQTHQQSKLDVAKTHRLAEELELNSSKPSVAYRAPIHPEGVENLQGSLLVNRLCEELPVHHAGLAKLIRPQANILLSEA